MRGDRYDFGNEGQQTDPQETNTQEQEGVPHGEPSPSPSPPPYDEVKVQTTSSVEVTQTTYQQTNPSSIPTTQLPGPSAPPLDLDHRDLEHLSYDQTVNWWNALTSEQRNKMQTEGEKLSAANIAQIRRDYKKYYPNEYYPKRIDTPDRLNVYDYYIMYYLCEEMVEKYKNDMWFSAGLISAFEVPPPPYDYNDYSEQKPTQEEARRFWDALPSEKQQALKNKKFTPEQVRHIQRENRPYYRTYYPSYMYGPSLNYFDFYLMSRYPSRFYGCYFWTPEDYIMLNALQLSFEVTRAAVYGTYQAGRLAGKGILAIGEAVASGVKSTGGFLGAVGNNVMSGNKSHSDRGSSSHSRSSDSNNNSRHNGNDGLGAILLGLGVLLAVLAAAASALIASVYAGIKAAASISNLVQGKKRFRSFCRLASMAAGGYLGAIEGASLGAMAGSVIPGVGTAAGAIVGAIFGAPIVAAIAGAASKYVNRYISWRSYGNTNPEKWDVAKTEKVLHDNGIHMNTREITQMFAAIKGLKNQSKTYKGSILQGREIAGTKANTYKNQYNKFLDAVKKGFDPHGIRVDSHTRFIWDGQQKTIVKQNIPLPTPVGLKM